MIAVKQQPVEERSQTRQSLTEERVEIYDVTWEQYEAILTALDERQIHLTYDRGVLEIMTLSSRHERRKSWIGRLVEALSFELHVPLASFGSTTFQREDLARGMEPDECYYIANEPLVRGREDIDTTRDPPPDLGIEIDVTRSSERRVGIYAALRVPEIWRYDGESLRVYHLREDGQYELKQQSLNFPFLPNDEFATFLKAASEIDDTTRMHSFVDWVRSRVLPHLKKSADGASPKPS